MERLPIGTEGLCSIYQRRHLRKVLTFAKMTLATCYFHTLAVHRNDAKLIRLCTECIDTRQQSCIGRLAPCYEHGLGADIDLQKAAELCRMGSDITSNPWRRHYIQASYGMFLFRGRGVKEGVKKGFYLIHGSV